jgi:hypothetical protein
MTWGEIEKKFGRSNTQNHEMPVKKICKTAQERLSEIKLDDIDCLYSIRVSAKERLWGIRKDRVLYIIWWDPEHTVYTVSKK